MSQTAFTRAAASRTPSASESRGFLQERLAYLGRTYASIGISFYVVGNLAAAALGDGAHRLADPSTWIMPAACATYLAQWLLTRDADRSRLALHLIDATVTTLAAGFHSLMVFTVVPGEIAGMSYTRALLLVSFGLLIRAVIVPSAPLRTLALGGTAAAFATVTSGVWYAWQPAASLPLSLHTVLTALWSLGAVVISTLASRVIYGLRSEVRQAKKLGQYTLLEKIGEGAVYRASHAMLRRPTAIKLLPLESAGAEHVQRFEREVQFTSQLTHPNTISIFDYGRTPDGVFYYAMEYLEGLTLEQLVRMDGPQPAARVVHILRQIAASLSEAHGVGLVHRDIKPGNVILVPERAGTHDVVKVVDFGLVKELDEDTGLTREGRITGTPHYLAPEVIVSPRDVVPQSDLYALGCVGYYLVTGQTVFKGKTVIEVCSHHLSSPPVPPAERLGQPVPEALSELLLACLAKSPANRPASAQALVEMLDASRVTSSWSSDRANAWWRLHGPDVIARVRHREAAPRPAEAQLVDHAAAV
jgi:serine/threonine-protein kinase